MLEQLGLTPRHAPPPFVVSARNELRPDDDEPAETSSEMAKRLGISRQLAHYRLRRKQRPQGNDHAH